MTRTGDIAPPVVPAHVLPPDAPIARWRYKPVIALERLPQAAYTWDDADPDVTWDDTTPQRVWDAPFVGQGFTDAACDFIALDIDAGTADDLYLFPPVTATLTLDNRTGEYTPWTADGRLVYWAPGRRMSVLADDGANRWWLFSGRVASWQANADGTVTVTAFDGLAWLAQQLGGQQTFGAAGQTPAARVTAAATAAGYPDRIDADVGQVTLATVAAPDSPLEHIQRVALSDGGLFYGDADGSLDYRDRAWRAGRADQTTAWVISDNVCTVPVVMWNPEASTDDDRLATDVRLVNTAGLAATATLTGSLWAGDARYRLTHPDPDLWQTQAQGDALAAYLLAQQGTPSASLRSADLYALDPKQPAVFDYAVQMRRGDRVRLLHDFVDPNGNPATLDVYVVLLTIGHTITPDEWVTHLSMSRTVDVTQVERWDRTVFVWDQVDARNVWRY